MIPAGRGHDGVFVIDSDDGRIMIDSGRGEKDSSLFVDDIKQLGLNTNNIKLILITYEHLDHYGNVQFLKQNVYPNAKFALSAIWWYYLQARPTEPGNGPYANKP